MVHSKKRFFKRKKATDPQSEAKAKILGNKSLKIREKKKLKVVVADSIGDPRAKQAQITLEKKPPLLNERREVNGFPNISKTITEQVQKMVEKLPLVSVFSRRVHSEAKGNIFKQAKQSPILKRIFIALVLILGIAVLWQLFILAGFSQKLLAILHQRGELQAEMQLWEDIATKFPNYRDADFQVAVLAYQLGDRQKEQEYLQKTLAVDPNFQPARDLQGK